MAYIEPNTNITLYRNTGLSMSYENTLYFASEDDKDLYWAGASNYIAATFNKCSYQRSNRGVIRVEKPISYLYKVDYMRFKNVSYENKFYYAFVTHVEYVNNETTAVYYVLDPIMTWMGTFQLKQCLVVRQHSVRDRIGDSLTDEGMQCGEYVTKTETMFPSLATDKSYSIVITVADEGGSGSLQGGVYSANKTVFCDSPTAANEYIASLVSSNLADNIISIFMCPSEYTLQQDQLGYYNKVFTFDKGNTDFDGYVPRNNKLFIYPYHEIVVSNNNGSEQIYRPEMFTLTDENIVFNVYASVNNGIQVIAVPTKYKGQGQNWEEAITLGDFPMCSWNYDTYQAWLAQYIAYYPQQESLLKTQQQASIIKTAANGLVNVGASGAKGAVSGALGGGILSGLNPVGNAMTGFLRETANAAIDAGQNTLGQYIDNAVDMESMARDKMTYSSVIPTTAQVTQGKVTPNILYATGVGKGFRMYDKKIMAQQAMVIDDYFTMYGYAVNQVEVPQMNNRLFYTYVKTCGCNVGGNVPAEDARAIEQIFDTGVRFWKELSNIGHYDVINTPNET